MQAKPLVKYKIPNYPTRLEIDKNPQLLCNNLPPAWLNVPRLAGVAAVLLAASACTTEPPDSGNAAIVAPIFEHGEGYGATGCVVVSPPVFLSEEEALQIIIEELGKAGINASEENVELDGVSIAQREINFSKEDGEWEYELREIPGTAKPLQADVLDNEHHVGIEFVSSSDYYELGGPSSFSTVQDYALKEIAGYVAGEVEEKGEDIYFGVFYDPVSEIYRDPEETDWEAWEATWEAQWDAAKQASEQLLREQVKDFVDWLEAQGVI